MWSARWCTAAVRSVALTSWLFCCLNTVLLEYRMDNEHSEPMSDKQIPEKAPWVKPMISPLRQLLSETSQTDLMSQMTHTLGSEMGDRHYS